MTCGTCSRMCSNNVLFQFDGFCLFCFLTPHFYFLFFDRADRDMLFNVLPVVMLQLCCHSDMTLQLLYKNCYFCHPSVCLTAYPVRGHGGVGGSSSQHWEWGGINSGQSRVYHRTKLETDRQPIILWFIPTVKLELSFNLTFMILDYRRNPCRHREDL